MKNHPHLIILNQKTNTDTQSIMTLTLLCNPESQKNRKNTYGALIHNYQKVSFVLAMYVLPNQVAFFISSE